MRYETKRSVRDKIERHGIKLNRHGALDKLGENELISELSRTMTGPDAIKEARRLRNASKPSWYR